MNCHKAQLLINKYLENRLDERELAFFKDHLTGCESCSSSLELAKALFMERSLPSPVKAPGDFTLNVMAAIYKTEDQNRLKQEKYNNTNLSIVYRRLGFSLVLTAAIALFTFLVPLFGGYPGDVSGPIPHSGEASGYVSVFTGFDTGLKGLFKTINKSVVDFKGGTNNEM